MQFAIEEQGFTDPETGVRYQFEVDRQDTSLVRIVSLYEDGHSRVTTYARNGGVKSEESFPAGVVPTAPVLRRENPAPQDPQKLNDDINPPPNADGTPAETEDERRQRQMDLKAQRQADKDEADQKARDEADARLEKDGGVQGQPMLDSGLDDVPAISPKPATTQAPVDTGEQLLPVGAVNTSRSLRAG